MPSNRPQAMVKGKIYMKQILSLAISLTLDSPLNYKQSGQNNHPIHEKSVKSIHELS